MGSASPRSLITGGTGFVGANLVRHLLNQGHEVHLLARAARQSWRIADIQSEIQMHLVDLLDREAVATACKAIRPDCVFHLAASGAYSWQQNTDEMIGVNLAATAHLIEATRDAAAFIHAGSSSEYGFKDHPPAEDQRPRTQQSLRRHEIAATNLCRMVAQRDRRRVITLRLYSVYGPFEEPKRLIPTLLLHGLGHKYPPLVSPDTARDFVHVDDVSAAFLLAATHAGADNAGIYNVGSGTQTTVKMAVETVRTLFNIPDEPQWNSMPGRVWDTSSWVSNPSRIAQELGWRATTPFLTGLEKTRDWLSASPERLQRYRSAIFAS